MMIDTALQRRILSGVALVVVTGLIVFYDRRSPPAASRGTDAPPPPPLPLPNVTFVFIHGTEAQTRAWLAYPEHARLASLPQFLFLSTTAVPLEQPLDRFVACPRVTLPQKTASDMVHGRMVCFVWLVEASPWLTNRTFILLEHDVFIRDADTFVRRADAVGASMAPSQAIVTLQGLWMWLRGCQLDRRMWWCGARYTQVPYDALAMYSQPRLVALALMRVFDTMPYGTAFDTYLYENMLARGAAFFTRTVGTVADPFLCLMPTGSQTAMQTLLRESPSCAAWHTTSSKQRWPQHAGMIAAFLNKTLHGGGLE
jgi:hypothetical protein